MAADATTPDPIGALSPILIANRGEIAIRVARSAHALGLSTVAVFCEPDRGAPHIDFADQAIRIDSYLDPAAVISAAQRSGARSVHPGYGFLSENAAFARAVGDAGLTWIGPPPEAIELMGDKARSKELAREAGVPVVPGTTGHDASPEEIAAFAAEHGTPVLIKAVAGGGGKGMRVVRDEAELEAATAAARREAEAAFGDGRVLVERYLERPRHLEIQVLADAHGGVVHFGERECSLQRRHQKVIEEAPSPVVDEAMRQRMGLAAVELTRACGYRGAGTVEFIAPIEGEEFFFLEMNTRLQVEHPVTELVYGVDLVEGQLRVAADQHLGPQGPIKPSGHAVEARLYAEDPAAGFLPAVGTIRRWRPPTGEGVRVDAGIRDGSVVGTDYDPMLAKVIAYGPDRPTAIRRLDRALAEMELLGIANNAAFSRELLGRSDIAAGMQDTGLLERVMAELDLSPPADLLAAAAMLLRDAELAGSPGPTGPWSRRFDRHGVAEVSADGSSVTVTPEGSEPREVAARIDPLDESHALIEIDGIARTYVFAIKHGATRTDGATVWISRDGHHLEAKVAQAARATTALAGSLDAPMPGKVLAVEVANGDRVSEGDLLILLESMKMELQITAPNDGEVAGLSLAVGDQVGLGQALVAVTPDTEDESA